MFVTQQDLIEMARDNLTEGLSRWRDAGVKKEDLAAVTLYTDFWSAFLNSDSMLDTATSLIQMKQGKYSNLYSINTFQTILQYI